MNVNLIVSIAESAMQMLGFPCTKSSLEDGERRVLKKLAIAYGKKASKMSDEELIDMWNSMDISALKAELDDESGDGDGTGEAERDAESEADADGDGDSDAESESDGDGDEGSGLPEFDEFVPTNALEESIVDIIKKVHPTLDDGMHDNVDVDLVKKLIEESSPNHVVEIKHPDGEIIKDDSLKHEKLPIVLKALLRGDNVLLVGGAGSGKTTMAQSLTSMLGQAFKQDDYSFGMSGAMFQAYEVRGYMDANGNYVESSFVKCYRDGGLFLFDEIDGSNPQALVALNASMENDYADFPCGVVKKHPNFRLIACANTYGRGADREYVGRNQLDGATIDRFKPVITLDYDEKLELAISPDRNFTKIVQKLRKAKDEMKIRCVISPRASIKGGRALLDGCDMEDVLRDYVFGGLDADTVKRIRTEAGV
tara:strand:- start:1278 stop:2552 length:1275 start_codon:yes stop_codon:yes gene_type:complete